MAKITIAQLSKLAKDGKIRGYSVSDVKANPKQKRPATTHRALEHIRTALRLAGVEFVEEYRFSSRRFRFDIALPQLMVAIEYEGIYSKKSRHTTQSGYSKDAEKYNEAVKLGWRILRYTAKNYKQFENDLKNIMNIC